MEINNAPNLEYVPNVEMTNAVVNNARNANNLARNEAVRRSRAEAVLAKEELKAKRAKEAANQANANARKAAVDRSKAEAAATRAAKKAEREGSSSSNTANNAARKAANNAAKKANANAKKAAANAEKLAANAKKAAVNAVVKNVENKLEEIKRRTNINKTRMNKMGRIIYLKATKKVHPNSGGNQVSFQKLGNIYNKFKNFTGTRVTAGFNETWTA